MSPRLGFQRLAPGRVVSGILHPTEERERGGGKRCSLLIDEESGLTRCLDRGLPNGRDSGVEFLDGGCGDGDEAGVAEDAVAGGEVGFFCWSTSWYSAVWEASSICPILASWAWSEMCSTFFLRMSRAAWSERIGVQMREKDRWMPVESRTGERKPG